MAREDWQQRVGWDPNAENITNNNEQEELEQYNIDQGNKVSGSVDTNIMQDKRLIREAGVDETSGSFSSGSPSISDNDSDQWVDSAEEINRIVEYAKPEVKLSDASDDLETYDTSSGNKAAQVFGFAKSKFDEKVDRWKENKKNKDNVYNKFLSQSPASMTDPDYDNKKQILKNVQGLGFKNTGVITEIGDQFGKFFKGLGKGLNSLAQKDPERFLGFGSGANQGMNSSDKVMNMIGLTGSKFGDFPSGQNLGTEFMSTSQSNMQMPQEAMNMGMEKETEERGVQLPKYQAAPINAEPGTTYTRVTRIDSSGKKRSSLRKVKIPEFQSPNDFKVPTSPMPQPGMPSISPPEGMPVMQPQQMNMNQQPTRSDIVRDTMGISSFKDLGMDSKINKYLGSGNKISEERKDFGFDVSKMFGTGQNGMVPDKGMLMGSKINKFMGRGNKESSMNKINKFLR